MAEGLLIHPKFSSQNLLSSVQNVRTIWFSILLIYVFTYFIQFIFYWRRPNLGQERWSFLPKSLMLINSKTGFNILVLKFSLQLILLRSCSFYIVASPWICHCFAFFKFLIRNLVVWGLLYKTVFQQASYLF